MRYIQHKLILDNLKARVDAMKSNKKVRNKCNKRDEIKTPDGAMQDFKKVFRAWFMNKNYI